jgi:uncharacterized protein (DUF4415 family)
MQKNDNIVRYSAAELAAMRGESQTGWNRIEVMTEEEITAAIASDPDSAIPPEDWEDTIMGILDTVEPKKHVNFRLDMDAGRWFKAQGRGYQTKMNAVLRAYILAQWKKQQ